MYRNLMNPLTELVFVSTCFILLSEHPLQAQIESEETPLTINLEKRWRVEVNGLLGVGLNELLVGKSNENDDIKISGGGGIGGSLIIGYGFSKLWDLSFGVAIQNSSLQPQVENAKGNFFRTSIAANLKYRIEVAAAGFINFGGGISYYSPGNLDMDLGSVSGGAHNIYGYDNATGFQLLTEYEGFFSEDLGWIIGVKYSNVRYKLNSAESNGISLPLRTLPAEIMNDIAELDGSSLDLVLSLAYYF